MRRADLRRDGGGEDERGPSQGNGLSVRRIVGIDVASVLRLYRIHLVTIGRATIVRIGSARVTCGRIASIHANVGTPRGRGGFPGIPALHRIQTQHLTHLFREVR